MISATLRSSSLLKFKNRSSRHLLRHSLPFSSLSTLLQGPVSRPHLLQVHARVFRSSAHHDNLIATRLIGHYPPRLALRVFQQLDNPNIFPFNAIIRVSAEKGQSSDAISFFRALKRREIWPNDLTFSFVLKACFKLCSALCVQQIQTHILKAGFYGDPAVCNGLLSFYAKALRDLVSARKLFDEVPDRGLVFHWTSLIAGCARSGCDEDALQLFVELMVENLRPDDDTMINVLSACSAIEIAKIGKWVDVLLELTKRPDIGHAQRDPINTVLIFLFSKWGRIEESRQRFDEISDEGKRNVVPWNVMITAFVQNGSPMEALNLFRGMIGEPNRSPNHVTMVSVLSACAQVGDLDLGIMVHDCMKKGTLETNIILATALIDMYSKCGSLERAQEVFNRIAQKDAVSFNAMIMGLATNGSGEEALRLFHSMKQVGIKPNAGTFLAALCACTHGGLVDMGRQIFCYMTKPSISPIKPNLEHYSCYIDLLSRMGHIEEALEIVSSMPFEPNEIVWGALLSGCLLHGRAEEAQYVSRRLVEVDPANSAGYVMLANILAADQEWRSVSVLRGFMREKGVRKQPGNSWISIDGVVHEFLVGWKGHPQIEMIYQALRGLEKAMNFPS
ncbi:putative pentatricopeptide repeat-containing protein At3g08820 [Punica granatum]|uniref:Uncharacterized protein n=2 Tax=Punica granatum TaxID=22663 RepID=A0A218VWF2_PUNGR|nr:putative pentatricopeptide repeat-containing protein At3g08820 [Punica granatum]OWM64805.1 hypothetical protein CDL15_Pgr028522 [Punica granatum]PKI71660.1 hypothetical protein CRG98_007983 [Punica granatum]